MCRVFWESKMIPTTWMWRNMRNKRVGLTKYVVGAKANPPKNPSNAPKNGNVIAINIVKAAKIHHHVMLSTLFITLVYLVVQLWWVSSLYIIQIRSPHTYVGRPRYQPKQDWRPNAYSFHQNSLQHIEHRHRINLKKLVKQKKCYKERRKRIISRKQADEICQTSTRQLNPSENFTMLTATNMLDDCCKSGVYCRINTKAVAVKDQNQSERERKRELTW